MWTIKHHKQFEKLICSKCPADINRDYAPCAKCKRSYDFEAGYKAGKRKNKALVTTAVKLLKFWVNDFYDNFNHANKYEERHKALVETEQFIKETNK